ncbi:MAG: hypothetical protein JWN16_997 [Alphaproteobacteria bacterium]|jgi:hypothetical protein|nr:hypothetical protein [Alphaproteobacteria bacterium]
MRNINKCYPGLLCANSGEQAPAFESEVGVLKSQRLLDLAARFRECAVQTGQDHYAKQMLRAAIDLESQAAMQRKARTAEIKARIV